MSYLVAAKLIGLVGALTYLILTYLFSFRKNKSIIALKERGLFFLSWSSIAGFVFFAIVEFIDLLSFYVPNWKFEHRNVLILLTLFSFTSAALFILSKIYVTDDSQNDLELPTLSHGGDEAASI